MRTRVLFLLLLFFSYNLTASAEPDLNSNITYCSQSKDCQFFDKFYDADTDFKNSVNQLIKKYTEIDDWLRYPLTVDMALILDESNPLLLYYVCAKQNCTDDHYVISYNKKTKSISGLHYKNNTDEPIEVGELKNQEKTYLLLFNNRVTKEKSPKSLNEISSVINQRTITLSNEKYSSDQIGEFDSWKCMDFLGLSPQKILIEAGRFLNPKLDKEGFVLYDGSNSGEITLYKRAGLNHRWDWGKNAEYAFTIKPDGTGLYYDFSGIPKGETTKASQIYKCSK
ncbi:MAG: hypothetical protein KA235_09070 [Prevotella sp.]|jgi:hypothetical protein|nr:hypothetical protein [Prevotella sp.]